MRQASGSIMTGIRTTFSAHLPLISLLWPSTALRLRLLSLSGECRCLVLLDYVQDNYVVVVDPLFPFVLILNTKNN